MHFITYLVSNVYFNCIVQDSLYSNMDIGTMWHCALISCTPSQSIGLFLCALLWCWVSLCAPFTISLIEFYFIMIFIMIVVTIIGILWPFFSFLNYMFRLSGTKFWFCKSAVPWMFPTWIFSLNIELNMLPLDSFMSCLRSLLGYSTGVVQALQLVVLAAFGAMY